MSMRFYQYRMQRAALCGAARVGLMRGGRP
jgi:hypothetical protein